MPAIIAPRLGLVSDELTVLRWHCAVGAEVAAGEPLVDLAAEKAISVLEASQDGVLRACDAPAGAVIRAGATLGWLDPVPDAAGLGRASPHDASRPPAHAAGQTPVQADAMQAIPAQDDPPQADPPQWVEALRVPAGNPSAQAIRAYMRESLRPTTALRMTHSWRAAPKVDLFAEIDFSAVVQDRQQRKADGHATPSYNIYIAHAVAQAFVHDAPSANLNWIDDAPQPLDGVHIGLAVAFEQNLLTISMRHTEDASLEVLDQQFRQRLRQALRLRLKPHEMYGNSMTISNLGEYQISAFTPILNPPEVFILGIGELKQTLYLGDDQQVYTRPTVTFCLSFDHRAVDGAPASRLLQCIKTRLEQPPTTTPTTTPAATPSPRSPGST